MLVFLTTSRRQLGNHVYMWEEVGILKVSCEATSEYTRPYAE